jgi:hypothetical protein
LKHQGICLQHTQTSRGVYVIWPLNIKESSTKMGDILESSRVASLPFCQESSNLVALSAFLHEKNKGSNRLHHCCNYRIIKLKFLNIKKMEKRNKRKR